MLRDGMFILGLLGLCAIAVLFAFSAAKYSEAMARERERQERKDKQNGEQ